MLDLELKQKLAKAARDLADEVEANKGPELGFGSTFNDDGTPCCAMGHVYHRAGVTKDQRWDLAREAPGAELLTMAYLVENANDAKMPHRIKLGVVRQPLPDALRDYAMAVEGL